jgi:hypothetical protein
MADLVLHAALNGPTVWSPLLTNTASKLSLPLMLAGAISKQRRIRSCMTNASATARQDQSPASAERVTHCA